MFAKKSVSQSMIDAVNAVITEDEKKQDIKTEGWDDMVKAAKDTLKDKPQDGASGMKKGSRYGGSKQKDEKEPVKKESVNFRDVATQVLSGDTIDEASDTYKDAMAKQRAASTDQKLDVARGKMKQRADEPKSAMAYAAKTFVKHAKNPLGLKKEETELDEEGNCVTPPQAKDIAKKQIGKHEKKLHKEFFVNKLLTHAKDLQENKGNGPHETFTDNNMGEDSKMTDAQMKKREKIVMSMKDKGQYFKKKYGAKWKNVMYATATKQAMGEELNYDESQDMEHISEEERDKVTTDMLRGRVDGGQSNDFKSFKVKLHYGLEKSVAPRKDEDTIEKQKITTNPGAVDIKFDDKLGSTPPQHYFSKQTQVSNEEVVKDKLVTSKDKMYQEPAKTSKPSDNVAKAHKRVVGEGVGDTVKKFLAKVGGGSDSDHLKRLQKDMGVAQTGKKPEPKNEEVRGELVHIHNKVNSKRNAEVKDFKSKAKGSKLVKANEEKISPLDTAQDIAKKSFRKIRKETMMGKISN